MTLSEPDVALTDFALALECAGFSAWLSGYRGARTPMQRWFVVFFVSVGSAALFGGITHGFLPDPRSPLHRLLWAATLLSIGVTALAGWILAAQLVLSAAATRRVAAFATVAFAAYAAVVLLVSQSFAVAIIFYLPAAASLLAAFVVVYRRRHARFASTGIGGLALSGVAAWVQQSGISLHPLYFNHNALYHLIQAVALLLIFLAARYLVDPRLSEIQRWSHGARF